MKIETIDRRERNAGRKPQGLLGRLPAPASHLSGKALAPARTPRQGLQQMPRRLRAKM